MKVHVWLGTLLAAWIGSSIGLFLILPLGLIVMEFISFPMALGFAALLAESSASWAGTRLATDQTQTRLLAGVGVAEITAVAIVLLFLTNASLRERIQGPWIGIGALCSFMLAFSASMATWHFRESRQGARGQGRLALILLGLAVLLVPIVIWVASRFGLTGA